MNKSTDGVEILRTSMIVFLFYSWWVIQMQNIFTNLANHLRSSLDENFIFCLTQTHSQGILPRFYSPSRRIKKGR